MPGKSRHGKGKHPHLSKKSRAKQRHAGVSLLPKAAADIPQPDATISKPSPSRMPALPTASKATQHPYITAELRRIGILAGIILVILIVLAVVLS